MDEGDILHLCSTEPTTYAEATTNSVANRVNPIIGAISDGPNGARQRVIQGFTNGLVATQGLATAWALVDSVSSRLLLADLMENSINLALGTPVELSSISVIASPQAGINMTPVLDFGLDLVTNNSEEFRLFPSIPADYAAAGTGSLASFLSPVINAPASATGGGYQVSLEEFEISGASTNGAVAAFAFLDNTNTRILLSGPISPSAIVSTDRGIEIV